MIGSRKNIQSPIGTLGIVKEGRVLWPDEEDFQESMVVRKQFRNQP